MNCNSPQKDKSVINIFFLSLKFNSTYIQFKNKVICRLYKCSDQIKFNRVLKQFNDNSFDSQRVNLTELLQFNFLFYYLIGVRSYLI